jgi:hypothetical protein
MGMGIIINFDKAKEIAHKKRRAARAAEFAPLDIKATIPSEAEAAELARQKIRDKYAVLQEEINAAQNVEELKDLMP